MVRAARSDAIISVNGPSRRRPRTRRRRSLGGRSPSCRRPAADGRNGQGGDADAAGGGGRPDRRRRRRARRPGRRRAHRADARERAEGAQPLARARRRARRLADFMAYAQADLSSENLEFWVEVNAFRAAWDGAVDAAREAASTRMVDTFLRDGAEKQVCIGAWDTAVQRAAAPAGHVRRVAAHRRKRCARTSSRASRRTKKARRWPGIGPSCAQPAEFSPPR